MAQSTPAGAPTPAALDVAALEPLFQLGLPDTRKAKWVRVEGEGMENLGLVQDRFSGGRDEGGNAWLLKEEADGTVELVVRGAEVIKAHKSGGLLGKLLGKGGAENGLETVEIQSANVGKDLKALAEQLKQLETEGGRFDNDDDEDGSGVRGKIPGNVAGTLVLFCAHLQRHGEKEEAKALLANVLKLRGSPQAALADALSVLADGRLARLTEGWKKGVDRETYAKGVEALVAEFTRGWQKRAAAQMLVQRLRAEKPASTNPKAKAAAELLLGLKAEDVGSLPMNSNWLLPGAEEKGEDGDEEANEDEAGSVRKLRGGARSTAKKGAVQQFFAQPREAVAALALLVGDERYLRVGKNELNGSNDFSSYSSQRGTPEEMLKAQYDSLSRPMELGEFVNQLLSPLLPDHLDLDEDTGGSAVRAWVENLRTMSDEELAWDYLRNARRSSDTSFGQAMRYLTQKGSPETLVKLEPVFQDPAVWQGDMDDVMGHLERYLKRYAGEPKELAVKVRAAVKSALEEQRAETTRYGGGSEEYTKMLKSQETAMLKRLDQVFTPTGAADGIAELLEADETEARALLGNLARSMEKRPRAEMEALLFPAAVKAKLPMTKQGILFILMGYGREPGKKTGPPAEDAATRSAMTALLAEMTLLPGNGRSLSKQPVALSAAQAILWPHFSEKDRAVWSEIYQTAPQLVPMWLMAEARAVAAGQPIPPRPDATRVNALVRDAIIAELGALPPEKITAALAARTPDEQMALGKHLASPETTWPAGIGVAHLTVTKVEGEMADELNAKRWQGRRIDESLIREVEEALEKAVGEGKGYSASLGVEGVLGGARISVEKNPRSFSKAHLAALSITIPDGPPAPVGAISQYLRTVADSRGAATYSHPVWKDPALTKAWVEKFHASSATTEEKPARGGRTSNDPLAFEKALKPILALDAKSRGPFMIYWASSKIEEPKDSDPDER